MAVGQPMARERRHTLYFLEQIRSFSPVFLDTEVGMSAVLAHQAATRETKISLVTYLAHTAGRVLVRHPDANAAVTGRLRLRVARYSFAHAKVTLDSELNGNRVVLAVVLHDVHSTDLSEAQAGLDHARQGDPARSPAFAGVRALHAASPLRGRLRFRHTARSLALRPLITGTFAVTSLGHRDVDGFHSVGGTTVTFGLGRVRQRPVVVDGRITAAPVVRLSLAFDHRVIDGAEAADVLTEVKQGLEAFGTDERTTR
ncbi:2-oxo acid dehydrogenase subunit E2 [Saccharothrix obliqua]|uniref:2-oxo acid dehydrogenase subunit E2 n=1 Tax=Saccharothrix obliqua TaxID=2861747 RepID=UPI001C5E67E7|nr:2-oxo acid dehydrogenase subunit E2 [Saccharothrix obliqua]MBW4717860.1 2-oxo acid dehydrogenase subunit E2 [Saccharothrix obliqua]